MDKKGIRGNPVTVGQIMLSGSQKVDLQEGQGQGTLFKKALILFEGTFEGMFGQITITPDFLQVMVERFNREFANPKNMFDYPPILVDHNRSADLVKGRLTGPLELQTWSDPRDGQEKVAMFGDIRIDDEDAQGKVIKGQYAHMSLSFDDDIENLAEIFELSFVAVEAARGAQALQQGEENMSAELKQSLESANKKVKRLKKKAQTKRTALLAACTSLMKNLEAMNVDKMTEELKSTITNLKTGVVKSQFSACVKEGRLSKADFDKLEISKIALMPADSRAVVLASYKSRPVSADLVQHGMSGAKPVTDSDVKLSASQMRAAIAAQKNGKALAADDQPSNPEIKPAAGAQDDNDSDPELTGKDIEEALGKLEGLAALQEKIGEGTERMKDLLSKLQGDDKDDDEEED